MQQGNLKKYASKVSQIHQPLGLPEPAQEVHDPAGLEAPGAEYHLDRRPQRTSVPVPGGKTDCNAAGPLPLKCFLKFEILALFIYPSIEKPAVREPRSKCTYGTPCVKRYCLHKAYTI